MRLKTVWSRLRDSEWRAWPVILAAGVGMGTGTQLYQYCSSLLMPHFIHEFGWTRGEISAATGLAGLGAAAHPLIGRWTDKMGVRPVALASCLALGAIYLGMAMMPGNLAIFFGLLLLIRVVQGGTNGIPQTRSVASWFQRNRGFALSLTLSVLPICSALFVPQFQNVVAAAGWRMAVVTLAMATVLVGLPIMMLLLREKARAPVRGATPLAMADGYDSRAGLRAVPLWLIISAMVCVNIPGGGILLHMAPLITDHGFSTREAAALIAVYPLSMMTGRLVTGPLLDRWPTPVAAATTLLPGVGYGLFLLAGGDMTYATAVVAIALLGLQQGVELDLLSFFLARHMGLRSYGFFYGMASMINAFAISTGTFLFGWAFDVAGTYDPVLLLAAFTFPAGAVCFFSLRWFPVFARVEAEPPASDALSAPGVI